MNKTAPKQLDFQSMIMNLHHYWASQGCLIWQPYYSQVGAGTMNPATFLRALGPEPWNVGYVEPSVRPDDGRYGDNPYRLQQHYQYQVILKPDPGNSQELYLRSLEVLGIDPAQHDIRFVEDNWESPALGSWGLGWEVWLDGQEITQFTYFQQGGGFALDPVSVEITYGLERIAMPLQRVRNYKKIQWAPGIEYGDINYQGEREHSTYYFETADVDNVHKQYELFLAEAKRCLEAGLVLPAHDYILKCSHAFNVLDTRGAIGITERQTFFRQMRELSRKNAEAYLNQRQALEYPLLDPSAVSAGSVAAAGKVSLPELTAGRHDLLVEIGTEELPAGDLSAAISQLEQALPTRLNEARLEHEGISVLGTPRRLVMIMRGLSDHQPDQDVEIKGPPASRAFKPDGTPTPAGEGFARSKGVDVSSLTVKDIDGGQYVMLSVHEKGKSAVQVLMELLPEMIGSLRFDKSMRWNETGVAFSRPIRWLVGLIGGQPLPFSYAGLTAGNLTRGLRFHASDSAETLEELTRGIAISDIDDYLAKMRQEGILIDPVERRAEIVRQIDSLTAGKNASALVSESLLDEVVNLIEAPTAFEGHFEPAYLSLPREVLISVMQKHQRYFPVADADGNLLPRYIGVRNGGSDHLDVVVDGNNLVLGARYADAAFFIEDDSRQKLEDFLPRLDTLVFQSKLGSMLDKTNRIVTLTGKLAPALGLNQSDTQVATRAALLSKADMATKMVVEMTSVQGIMGKFYAAKSGEQPQVAEAIAEHLLPRAAGDGLPAGMPGTVVGLADRFDSLAGLFAVGMAPTGTKDPYALRRTAIGLLQILLDKNIHFDITSGLAAAAESLPIAAESKSLDECFAFVSGRLRNLLVESGYRYDIVDAVLARQAGNPAAALADVQALSRAVDQDGWTPMLQAYSRCVRITREIRQPDPVVPQSLREPAEQALFEALQVSSSSDTIHTISEFTARFEPLIPVITRFFEEVMVMSDDPIERNNRLALLVQVAEMPARVADFSVMEGF